MVESPAPFHGSRRGGLQPAGLHVQPAGLHPQLGAVAAYAAVPCKSSTTVPCNANVAVPCNANAAVPFNAYAAVPCNANAIVRCDMTAAVPCKASTTVPCQASAAIRTFAFHRLALALWFLALIALSVPSLADEIDFNRDVKPILSENCFYCHGQDDNHRMADLRLDQSAAAVDAGALVPGSSLTSPLIERILSDDPDLRMPPADSNRTLTDTQKEILKRWIDQGAKYEAHWAFASPESRLAPA